MIKQQIILPYQQAKQLIKEADILLYRAGDNFVSKCIAKYTGGEYSHTGLAHWDGDNLMTVEEKEFKGGRSLLLQNVVKDNPYRIDIYRVFPSIWELSSESMFWNEIKFNEKISNNIMETAISITGNPYSWWNIIHIMGSYMPGWRLIRKDKEDNNEITESFVCSTVVAYAYRKNYIDLVQHIKDTRITPNDIARSALLTYCFTIGD